MTALAYVEAARPPDKVGMRDVMQAILQCLAKLPAD